MEIHVFLDDPFFFKKKGKKKTRKELLISDRLVWVSQMMWPEAKLLKHTQWHTADLSRKSQRLNDPLEYLHTYFSSTALMHTVYPEGGK